MPNSTTKRWIVLALLTGPCVYLLHLVGFPAAPLIGSLFAAVLVALRSDGMKLPNIAFNFGQAIIGLVIGLQMPKDFLAELQRSWPLFIGGVAWAVVISAALGWYMTKWRIFPGTTAIWGLSPGAATAMTVMSESYGGDIRIVAFMQYFRNTGAVVLTAVVSMFWVGVSGASGRHAAAGDWLVAPRWPGFLFSLLAVFAAMAIAKKLKMAGGAILVSMAVGMFFNYSGALQLDAPSWILSAGSTLLGWSIGLRFNREILRQIAHALPSIAGATLILILLCAGFSVFMVLWADIDPLTAYLATCPGGLDSIAIIAASTDVDVSFVLAMHSARFILVLLTGPLLARQIVKRVRRREALTAERKDSDGKS